MRSDMISFFNYQDAYFREIASQHSTYSKVVSSLLNVMLISGLCLKKRKMLQVAIQSI